MFGFIRYHWFGLLISIMVGLFMIQFFLVLFAPHHDVLNRGFSPCTETMAQKVADCGSKGLCVIKAVSANAFCDSKVIGRGLVLWIKGEQPRPWSNYLFVPEYPQEEEPDEGLADYYRENPDIAGQMGELKQKSEELEKLKDEHTTTAGMESD